MSTTPPTTPCSLFERRLLFAEDLLIQWKSPNSEHVLLKHVLLSLIVAMIEQERERVRRIREQV